MDRCNGFHDSVFLNLNRMVHVLKAKMELTVLLKKGIKGRQVLKLDTSLLGLWADALHGSIRLTLF